MDIDDQSKKYHKPIKKLKKRGRKPKNYKKDIDISDGTDLKIKKIPKKRGRKPKKKNKRSENTKKKRKKTNRENS